MKNYQIILTYFRLSIEGKGRMPDKQTDTKKEPKASKPDNVVAGTTPESPVPFADERFMAASVPPPLLRPGHVMALQRTIGNRATMDVVMRKMAVTEEPQIVNDSAAENEVQQVVAHEENRLEKIQQPPDVSALIDEKGTTAVIQKQAVAVPAEQVGAQGRIDAKDEGLLDNAQKLLDKAKADLGKIDEALNSYQDKGMSDLGSLESVFTVTCSLSDQALKKHQDILKSAADYAAFQDKLLGAIVDQMFFFVPNFFNEIVGTFNDATTPLKHGMGILQKMSGAAIGDVMNAPSKAVKSATGMGGAAGNMAKTPAITQSWAKSLNFYTSYSNLYQEASKLLPYVRAVGMGSTAHAKVQEAINGIRSTKMRRPDYSTKQIDTDAAFIWDACNTMASAVSIINNMVTQYATLLEQAKAVQPKDYQEIERDIWIQWIAGMKWDSTDAMDNEIVEKHLKSLGIWQQLGIDIGDYFHYTEEDLAWCSATAQSKILAHKGTAVQFNAQSNWGTISLPGLSSVAAVVDHNHSTYFASGLQRGYVVGARSDVLNTDMLEQGTLPHGVADWLIRNRRVQALIAVVGPVETKTE